ncbi:hypothetical protein P3W45_000967 [Vairimorpha bombi]|jgi:regulator of nonsense transcripts 1
MKCTYCDIPINLVECTTCNKKFCNSRSLSSISHIIFHLVKTKHKSIKITTTEINCLKCGEDNIFKLVKLNNKLYCKECCDQGDLIVDERCLTIIECPNIDTGKKLTKQQMTEIEEKSVYTLPTVKCKFEPEEYVNVFSTLIDAECQKEKEIKESMRQINVVVRWENMKYGYFYFHRSDADLKINIGDEIRLTHKSGLVITGFISNDSFTEELKFEVDHPGDYPRSGYSIEYIWRGVCYERMKWALNKLYNSFLRHPSDDLSIFEYLIKGSKEFVNNNLDIEMAPNLPRLNKYQEISVKAALSRKVTLIQGPPGTGKTLVSAAIVYNYVKKFKGKVLVVAPSNTAVDQLTLKIHKTGLRVLRVMSRRREYTQSDVNFLSLHENIKELQDTLKIKNTSSEEENETLKRQLLSQAEVITCTCVTAGQKMFNKLKFSCVLVDEAVQSTEPLTIIPLVYGCNKLILVGDHKQLGPTILSKKVAKAGFKQSLFERLISVGVSPYILSLQYRMHPDLCEWPSETFYNGELQTGNRLFHKINIGIPHNFFYACYGKEEVSASGTSFVNPMEALYCESIIRHLFKSGITENQIGVITPYEGQRSHILNRIFGSEPGNLEISNVDGFQGREKDYIIVSLVRSNLYQGIGFVGDKRRMNVALTRAKHGLIIIGNPSTMVKHEMWRSLLEFYEKKDLILEGPLGDLRKVSLVKPKKVFDFRSIAESINLQ